jgi:hypothetical protein
MVAFEVDYRIIRIDLVIKIKIRFN